MEAVVSQKRKNPFQRSSVLKQKEEPQKRQKTIQVADISEDDSLFNLINTKTHASVKETPPQTETPVLLSKKDSSSFSQESVRRLFESKSKGFLEEEDDDEDPHNLIQKQTYTKHLPVDWSIKTRLRMFSEIPLPNTNLKSNQEASGITSFVRCLDLQNSNSGLDISPAAKLNQSTYYWQHPHLPWMTLFPRNSKSNSLVNITANNDAIKDALVKDWNKSFKGLFQLLRARQCPYFYMFANSFSVLFRGAGIGGKVEMNAMLTPTSRGLRSALKQEGVEFTMPLKGSNHNKSAEKESSFNAEETNNAIEDFEDDDGEEDEEWLASLGVDKKEIIKNIASTNARLERNKEMAEDFSDISLVMIEGSECQALFNFLLNSKSLITSVGRLAGIPPTLLAPVAFPKASMQMLETKSNKLRMDGVDYFSIELKGIILPHVLPFVMNLFADVLDPSKTFSSTLATSFSTLAFGKATQKINEDEVSKSKQIKEEPLETEEQQIVTESDTIFFAENLSDSGIPKEVIKAFCRIGENSCHLLERVCFSKEHGYSWK